MICKRIAVLLIAVTACAASAAAQDAESSDARFARLERLVAQLQAQVDELTKERSPSPMAPVVEVNQTASTETHQADSPPPPSSLQTGPIRWGGEFRLYFDSLTRPASAAAPTAANTRGRYLLHLNMDAAIHRTLGVHVSLSTGAYNNPLTDIQDFGGGTSKHPISIAEAYADYRPNPYVTIQGGRVDSPFNDRLRFLYDTDTRFNGTNEMVVVPLRSKPLGITSIRFNAGQYFFTNPNVPVVEPGIPSTAANATPSQVLLAAGAEPGQAAPASGLFQQGVVLDHQLNAQISQHIGADVAVYRDPNLR